MSNIEHRGGIIADLIVTVSYAMKDELIQTWFSTDKIQVCYNGVDPQKYNPEEIVTGTNKKESENPTESKTTIS